ncbi:hypothetical protein IFR04_001815 [Cadophora malorum]|uniref:RRM domain-containing protein n=1 Tax=Cadophora malorum TaxID=108018 RepID=A0A8H8BUY2_9HELO|nr:hypothetical protein IFR04_001815 [Cadophora malorum]
MATGVVFGGYLQDTSIVEAEVPSLAQASTQTISHLAKECIKEYDLVCAALKETTGASAAASGFSRDDILIKIQDARVRFKAWATNIAALQGGHLKSSLDFRLREATEIRSRVLKILESLGDSLSDAVLIVKGVRGNKIWELGAMSDSSFDSDLGSEYNADGSDDGSVEEKLMTSELDELLSAIKTANSSLMDISIVIRNTPTRDDYIKAAARYSLDSHWDISHVDAKFGSAKHSNEWLIQRLGKSITRRRQYLTYRKEHHDKLSKDWDQPAKEIVVLEEEETKAPQTLALTKATTYVAGLPAAPKDGSEVGSFETETSYQQTVAGETEEHLLKVPPPPKEAFECIPFEFGQPFQCPYCWTEQNMKGRNAWKKHVFRDLRPYVCTFQECNLRMFRSRNEWFAHELQAHRREWTCASCSKIFSSRSSFRTHLISHNTSLAGFELDVLILQSEEPMDRFPATACSFCDEWEEQISNPNQNEKRAFLNEGRIIAPFGTKTQFRRHLGRHMEQLALFALPRDSLDDLGEESDREIRRDLRVDDSDATTTTTVSERHGSTRAASAGSRNEDLQVSRESHDTTELEVCFRCCQCNKISPTSIFKGLNCPSCDHERCARCAHWYGHFKESNGVWHDIREETSAGTDGVGNTIRGDYEKTDLGLQRSDRNANARAEDLDEQATIDMPTRGTTGENTTTIFIGFYTTNITEDELLFMFHSFGDIIGVRKPNDKPFAYIKFRHRDDAERAVAEMNRFVVRGCSLLVDFAATNYAGGVGNPSANEMPHDHMLQDSEDQLPGEQSVPGSSLQDEPGREFSIGENENGLPSQDINAVVGLIDTEGVPEYDLTGERLPANSPNVSRSPVAGPRTLSETATASVVRVNGLSDTVTEVELQGHFQSCGNITYLKVYSGRGSGEVKFARPTDAKLAVEEKNGSVLRGSKIQVALGYLTSSYWSISEQRNFPMILEQLGSDWYAIADCMESKTHVMVKDYYQYNVDEGKQEWVEIVKKADERLRNSPTPVPATLNQSTASRSIGDPDYPRVKSILQKTMYHPPAADRKKHTRERMDLFSTWHKLNNDVKNDIARISNLKDELKIEDDVEKKAAVEILERRLIEPKKQLLVATKTIEIYDAKRRIHPNVTAFNHGKIVDELETELEAMAGYDGPKRAVPVHETDRDALHSFGDSRVESSDDDNDNRLEMNRRRAEKKILRSSPGNLQDQPTSHSIGSDMEEGDAHPALLQSRDRRSSGTRRMRRRIEGDGTNLGYHDKLSEIYENGEDGGFSDATVGLSGVNKTDFKDEKKIVEAYEQRERELDQQRLQETDRESSEFLLEGQRVLNRVITSPDVDNNIEERPTYASPTVNSSMRSAKENELQKWQPELLAEEEDDEINEAQQLKSGEEETEQISNRLGRDFEEAADSNTVDPSDVDEGVVVSSPIDSDAQVASTNLQMDLKFYERVQDLWLDRGRGFCVLFRTRVRN